LQNWIKIHDQLLSGWHAPGPGQETELQPRLQNWIKIHDQTTLPMISRNGNGPGSGPTPCGDTRQPAAFVRIVSAAFSAIMMVGALVLLPVNVGMIDASITRNPSMP
jgi:hypothetical protein